MSEETTKGEMSLNELELKLVQLRISKAEKILEVLQQKKKDCGDPAAAVLKEAELKKLQSIDLSGLDDVVRQTMEERINDLKLATLKIEGVTPELIDKNIEIVSGRLNILKAFGL